MLRRGQKHTFGLSKNAPKKSTVLPQKTIFLGLFWQNSFLDKTILCARFTKIKLYYRNQYAKGFIYVPFNIFEEKSFPLIEGTLNTF